MRDRSGQIVVILKPKDKDKFKTYCENKQMSVSDVLRQIILKLVKEKK